MTPEKIKEHEALCTELIIKLPNGKWTNEVHRMNWKAHGLDCMILRQPNLGQLCGYVGVPPEHSLYGYSYDKVDVSVHGGITFSGASTGDIGYVSPCGDPDLLWWFGFDCAHCDDLLPGCLAEEYKKIGITSFTGKHGETYKDMEYVLEQTENLAKQLAERAA